MKELTIEQKAKVYDEAIKKAKGVIEQNPLMEYLKKGIEYIFPELKESKDEKIRKALMQNLKERFGTKGNMGEGLDMPDVLAWLEKQGNKELVYFDEAEKEKSDFVGDGFIKCFANFLDFKEGETYWLEYIGDDKYNVRSDNLLGKTYHITPCQLYTVFKKLTWLEKQNEQKPSAWSEDDKHYYSIIQYCLNNECVGKADKENAISWFKSLKDRVGCEANCTTKQEWSEEDKERIEQICDDLKSGMINFYANEVVKGLHYKEIIESNIEWLKSLRPQSTWRPSLAQLNALSIVSKGNAPDDIEAIVSLYNDLKKLKE